MSLTLSDLARRVASLDERDEQLVHAQLRNPAIRALLQPIDEERGRTSAVTYSPVELIRVRILTALIDIGHDARLATDVAAKLAAVFKPGWTGGNVAHPASAKVEGGYSYGSNLDALIAGVRAGESWELRIRFVREHGGQRKALVNLALEDWERDECGRGQATLDQMFGHTHLGHLTVPLSDLVRPLLSDVPAPDAAD